MIESPNEEDRQYASELLADLANGGMPRLEVAARWFRKARLENDARWDLAALNIVDQIWQIPADWPPARRKAHAQVLIIEELKAFSIFRCQITEQV